jgi:Macrocin-O-methyltransferase (TylF)/Polysaccharide pyruvyl transferase
LADFDQKYALLSYYTANLGDEVQSIAAAQFLPSIDLRIDRERLDRHPEGAAESYKVILNGWHTHAPERWPPGRFLVPLITSFHLTREVYSINSGGLNPAQVLLQGESLRYLREHGPIGARDWWTRDLLLEHGVDSFFSGCLTLTLGAGSDWSRADYVCAVDLPSRLLERMRVITRSRLVLRTHSRSAGGAHGMRAFLVRRWLSLYAQAKCVVTTRLHCALPCLAFGTPVLLVTAARDSYRFSGWARLLHTCSPEEFLDGVVEFDPENPPPNSDAYLVYRTALIGEACRFVGLEDVTRQNLPHPFVPEPLSEDLLAPEPAASLQTTREAGPVFQRIFPAGRAYGGFARPDFLRDIARVHGESGDLREAERLLQIALRERPQGAYIKRLLDEVRTATGPEAAPDGNARGPTDPVIAAVRHRRLTYLRTDRLQSIVEQVTRIQARDVAGDFVEFGVALGGSGICIASRLDGVRRYFGFDGFAMIPPPSQADGDLARDRYEVIAAGRASGIGGDTYYGYLENLYDVVVANFALFGLEIDQRTINLVRGSFQQTLPGHADCPLAFAHVDCDWYYEVKYCLANIYDRLAKFAVIIVDDYNDWPGCRSAVDEFCATHADIIVETTVPHAILFKSG